MARLLLVVALIVYLGWFQFPAGRADENTRIPMSVDRDQAVDQVQDPGPHAQDKVAAPISPARE
jgi:hypothetical protein